MGVRAEDRAELKDFRGLVANIDPDDLQPGDAEVQTNLLSARPASLEVRPGFRFVTFEDS
jgi:hypothetical protein